MVAELDAALKKCPRYAGTVYRNLSFDIQGGEALGAFALQHVPNMPISYMAFTSASKILDGYPVEGELTAHIEIESRSAGDISQFGIISEQEVLFGRDTIFLVDQVTRDGDRLYIKLEEIDDGH